MDSIILFNAQSFSANVPLQASNMSTEWPVLHLSVWLCDPLAVCNRVVM